jgi:hypothetical protein
MNKKIMATFAILMIALSIAGFAYAHWSDEIKINGKVEMGSLTFGFTTLELVEDGKMDYWTSVSDYHVIKPEPKPVGEVEAVLEEPYTDPHSGKEVYKKLGVTITNAYPEYVAQITYTLDNGGTIPLDVYMYCIWPVTDAGIEPLDYYWIDSNGDGALDCMVGHNAAGEAVINIWYEPLFWGQIDPCHSVPQTLIIHIKEPALMCHTYAFELVIHAQQWDP